MPRDSELARRFARSRPYKHLVLDRFLEPALLRAVRRDLSFPIEKRFLEGRGQGRGGIAICRDLASVGPGLARLDERLGSPEFIARLGRITGVRGLERNRAADCGGLFRYADDADMDVHLDSNDVDVHCAQVGHVRKINLLLYLTEGWRPDWGGLFELYRDPSRPPEKGVAPLFNRCVLFDSHDGSWHGVTRVQLPEGKRHLARLVVIVNYFSTDRKGARPGTPHYNVWMPRPLPERIRAGRRLTVEDALETFRLLRRREARLADLLRLEAACRGKKPAPAAEARDPFAALEAISPGLAPGRVLGRRDAAALRRAFAAKDGELRRLYRRQYGMIRKIKRRAPELVPEGY